MFFEVTGKNNTPSAEARMRPEGLYAEEIAPHRKKDTATQTRRPLPGSHLLMPQNNMYDLGLHVQLATKNAVEARFDKLENEVCSRVKRLEEKVDLLHSSIGGASFEQIEERPYVSLSEIDAAVLAAGNLPTDDKLILVLEAIGEGEVTPSSDMSDVALRFLAATNAHARAAAATALGVLKPHAAADALRSSRDVETNKYVRAALSAALVEIG